MVQLSTLLSLFLGGMGISLTLTGTVSALRTWRMHSASRLGSPGRLAEGFTEETSSDRIGTAARDDEIGERVLPGKGVGAIFSSGGEASESKVESAVSSMPSSKGETSRILLTSLAGGVVIVALYGLLVLQYSVNPSMQSWMSASFFIGAYFLNYPVMMVIAAIVGLRTFLLLLRRRRTRRISDPTG